MIKLVRYFGIRYFVIFSVTLMMAGCNFVPLKKSGDPGASDQTGDNQENLQNAKEDSPEKFASGGSMDVNSLNDPNSPLSQRVLYFDLESSEIKDHDREIITVHARFLSSHSEITVVLEGHADERGTREYNIALGEKRAIAVKQLMTLQGVAENQIQVISFGEERPVALGHDDAAWNLNRRVEILYSGY